MMQGWTDGVVGVSLFVSLEVGLVDGDWTDSIQISVEWVTVHLSNTTTPLYVNWKLSTCIVPYI